MLKTFNIKKRFHLDPGYYVLILKTQQSKLAAWIHFEREGNPNEYTFLPFSREGRVLVRLYARTEITICTETQTPSEITLSWFRLPSLAAAVVKTTSKSRLRHRVPLLGGNGYVCILSGIEEEEVIRRLRTDATLQQTLMRLNLDDRSICSPRLFDNPSEWLSPPTAVWRPTHPPMGRIGIFLHLYYTELWPEFAAILNQLKRPFDLWITHCGIGDETLEDIRRVFPGSEVIQIENRGRDVWPFISLLNDNIVGRYDYVCKIHSKKSKHGGGSGEGLLGGRWRRRALYDLLAFGRAEMICEMFASQPELGLVGPRALRLPNALYDRSNAWGKTATKNITRTLAIAIGAEINDTSLDFFAGSMFWARPAALESLQRLGLQREDFPEESGQLDGEIQHAIERLFSISTIRAGLKIGDVSPIENFPNGKTLVR